MSADLKVGILSQWYPPEPVSIPKTVADECVRSGHSVKVLTGFPSYPGGSLYPGYDAKSPQGEMLDESEVLRVPAFFSHDKNAIRRMRSFLSFAWYSVRNKAFLQDCDVVYVYGTPMTASIAALMLRIRRNIPFVIHLQDIWPESVIDSGMVNRGWMRSLFKAVISLCLKPLYSFAEHIVVISPGMKQALISRGVNPGKISTLLNWDANESTLSSTGSSPIETSGKIRCTYAGNIGMMQDVETIIRAAVEVQDEISLDVIIYGSGVAEESAVQLVHDLEAKNISFGGRVSSREMVNVYRDSDFQIVTLKNRDVFRMTIPSKFQAAISNGVPVITTVAGDLATICIENEIGLVADPEDPASLADAFRAAAKLGPGGRRSMASKARAFYWGNLSADRALKTLEQILIHAATTRTGRTYEKE